MKTTKLRLFALTAAAVCLTACGAGHAAKLSDDFVPASVKPAAATEQFSRAQTDFAISLLREEMRANPNTNIVLCPYGAARTLAASANGAVGETRTAIEQIFGGIPVSELNALFAGTAVPHVSSGKTKLLAADSVWFRDSDSLTVSKEFLQANADWYGADVFSAKYDKSTVQDMNKWIEEKTEGGIKVISHEDKPDDSIMLTLLSTLLFGAEWEKPYESDDLDYYDFTDCDGKTESALFMESLEDVLLINEQAIGFTKPYKALDGREYEFCAVVPFGDLTLADYMQTLSAESFPQQDPDGLAKAYLPQFWALYGSDLSASLRSMGLETAFDGEKADFTDMAKTPDGNIYINAVNQKTWIAVTPDGTQAKSGTEQQMAVSSADPYYDGQMTVKLDRPFIYTVRDVSTKIPLLIGAVQRIPGWWEVVN